MRHNKISEWINYRGYFELTKSFKDYKFPHTLRQFKDLPLAIKYRFQRAFRGWADYDVLHGLWK